ncbi:twin-arginine translocase subunit TatB [Rhodobacteraceae bacterium W635]|uniref:Sec-independent protein translocase protein TatB n=1 Tax=Nioella halotolerans TaxID=2303578 RepID=UPI000E3ECF73|nr:twin-arginine translocase subunit TatB [Rhodobacteraceae bacterium W635]
MFDIGMWELLVVGVVALIVVGPNDLPKMFRTLGQVTGKIRGMAREFQSTMNAAASESGFDDLSKDLKSATDVARDLRNVSNPRKMGMEAMKRAGAGIDGDEDPETPGKPETRGEPEKPLSETEKLAQKRRDEAEARVTAAKERAAARASAKRQPVASTAAADAEDDGTAAETAPRTGTSDT